MGKRLKILKMPIWFWWKSSYNIRNNVWRFNCVNPVGNPHVFLCDEEEVKRNETSESRLYLSDTPLYVKGWSWTWLRSEAGQGRGWEVQVSLEIIWNEKEYRYDTVKRVVIGVNPADGYTLFFWKDVTEVEQETNQFLLWLPCGKWQGKWSQ